MSTTIADAVVLEDTTSPASRASTAVITATTGRGKAALSWVAVLAVGGAAVVLAAAALRADVSSFDVDNVHTIAEHGSISAIDHRDALVLRARRTPGQTIAEHGSISAIENRDALVLGARRTPGQTVAEHGSVSAIDHRNALVGRR